MQAIGSQDNAVGDFLGTDISRAEQRVEIHKGDLIRMRTCPGLLNGAEHFKFPHILWQQCLVCFFVGICLGGGLSEKYQWQMKFTSNLQCFFKFGGIEADPLGRVKRHPIAVELHVVGVKERTSPRQCVGRKRRSIRPPLIGPVHTIAARRDD